MTGFDFDDVLLQLGETPVTLGEVVLGAAALLALLLLLALVMLFVRRGSASRDAVQAELLEQRARNAETAMAQVMANQNELAGRLAAMQAAQTEQQSALSREMDERLANVSARVSQSLTETTKSTQENLGKLQERLAVIDNAQSNIQALASDVVGLQSILQNKQTRGAFGQSRMEAIVQDGLPMGTFAFQATLSNGKRPDCVIDMPNQGPKLVVDAKFPLEAWQRLQDAADSIAAKDAATAFRRDMEVHIRDIADKYLLPGETQETAFLFVPSESIFAEIHETFEGIVQKAHLARVVIVSPSLLLLSIQVIQAVLKDARMREQAHLIQGEVAKFVTDLNRLDDRVRKLQSHFGATAKDIDQILISTDKLARHGTRIENMDFGDQPVQREEAAKAGKPFLRAIDAGE